MDKTSLGAIAIVAAVAGTGMYFMRDAYERQVADLHKQLDVANQQVSKREEAMRLAFEKSRAEERRIREEEAKRAADAVRQWERGAVEEVKRAADNAKAAQLERAIAERRAAEAKAAADRAKPAAPASSGSAARLHEEAQALEREGRSSEAVRAYRDAARAGSGKAALRLGEIYDKGMLGVARDYAESLKWYATARSLGEQVPIRGSPSSWNEERALMMKLAIAEREHNRAMDAQFNQIVRSRPERERIRVR